MRDGFLNVGNDLFEKTEKTHDYRVTKLCRRCRGLRTYKRGILSPLWAKLAGRTKRAMAYWGRVAGRTKRAIRLCAALTGEQNARWCIEAAIAGRAVALNGRQPHKKVRSYTRDTHLSPHSRSLDFPDSLLGRAAAARPALAARLRIPNA